MFNKKMLNLGKEGVCTKGNLKILNEYLLL